MCQGTGEEGRARRTFLFSFPPPCALFHHRRRSLIGEAGGKSFPLFPPSSLSFKAALFSPPSPAFAVIAVRRTAQKITVFTDPHFFSALEDSKKGHNQMCFNNICKIFTCEQGSIFRYMQMKGDCRSRLAAAGFWPTFPIHSAYLSYFLFLSLSLVFFSTNPVFLSVSPPPFSSFPLLSSQKCLLRNNHCLSSASPLLFSLPFVIGLNGESRG